MHVVVAKLFPYWVQGSRSVLEPRVMTSGIYSVSLQVVQSEYISCQNEFCEASSKFPTSESERIGQFNRRSKLPAFHA
jgi:hypothetical protein